MSLPCKINPLGIYRLPIGYLPALFLENTGSQFIDTEVKLSNESELDCVFEASSVNSTTHNNFIAGSQTSGYTRAFSFSAYPNPNPNLFGIYCYVADTNSNSMVPTLQGYYNVNEKHRINLVYNAATIDGERKELTGTINPYETADACNLFCVYRGTQFFYGKIFSFAIARAGEKQANYIPAIDAQGVPCMWDKVTKAPKYNAGTDDFIVGLTAEQALKLGKLPDGGGTLTISLPSTVVDENGVLQDMSIFTALSAATAKGWSFILQTHDGTAVETAVPLDYMECEFLESTREQWIVIPVDVNGNYDNALNVNTDITFKPTGTRQLMGLGGEGGDYWGCSANGKPEIGGGQELAINAYTRQKYSFTLINKTAILACDGETIERQNASISGYEYSIFAIETSSYAQYFCAAQLYSCQINENAKLTRFLLPYLDNLGLPCLYDTVTRQPFYNQNTAEGAADFVVGMTAAQAVQLANLPESGGELTVSLPQSILNDDGEITDAAVNAALNKAAENGWDITLQYYTN